MSLSQQLNRWIAESESWQSFIDFKLNQKDQADYPFLKRWEDFYLSLMSSGFDSIGTVLKETNNRDYVSLAKGLVIYSLDEKNKYFSGVDVKDNILYASGFYYLAGFPASAFLLSKRFSIDSYETEIDQFISSFLRREFIEANEYNYILKDYLESGNLEILDRLLRILHAEKTHALDHGYRTYSSLKLAQSLITHFKQNNIWSDLLSQNPDEDVWSDYIQRNIRKSVPIWSFFPSQQKAIESGALNQDSFSFQMPTSAGKTALSELLIYYTRRTNLDSKILYLAPFRSLASELKLTMGKDLGSLGISVKSIYGGHLPSKEEQDAIQTVDLLIATPEKLMAVEDVLPDLFDSFSIIICDEGHLLDDEHRGLSYELLLSRLKSAPVENRRFVFISAIIPNINTINEWLGGNSDTLVTSDYRPTELEFAFLERRRKSSTYDLNVNPLKAQPENYKLYRFLTPTELKYINRENGKETKITSKKGITAAVALKSVALGSVAVFCPEKRGNSGVEAVAEEILKQLEQTVNAVPPLQWGNKNVINNLHDYFVFLFGENYLLSDLVLIGALFHHGDLPQNVREVIEETLRKSEIRLVICTNTLAEGVNLPIRTMIIHSSDRFDSDLRRRVPLKARDLKNLVGRAGRAGKETSGLIIIPHSSDFTTMRRVILENSIEEVNGWLYELISRITRVLRQKGIELSNEVLDSQDDQFLQWLDSIDLALIDLLAEDIETDQLEDQVQELIEQTLSYAQSDDEQRNTLNQIFTLRSEKLQDYIIEGRFGVIKNSGSTIRNYEMITESFDLNDEIWEQDFDVFDERWIKYLFTDGIFELASFNSALGQFNEYNKCNLSEFDLLNIMRDWMFGDWYHEIEQTYEIEMYQLLRLINNFISFQVQNMVSSVVRIKMQVSELYNPSDTILNWPLYLQNGISSNQELALFELGLNDRVIVLELDVLLSERGFEYENFNGLQGYLLTNEDELLASLRDRIPVILIPRVSQMFNLIRLNIY